MKLYDWWLVVTVMLILMMAALFAFIWWPLHFLLDVYWKVFMSPLLAILNGRMRIMESRRNSL